MCRNFILGVLAIACAGTAVAQSNVTVFGVIDNNIGWGKGSLTSQKQVGTGGYLGSRLGFRGVEDLGGGLRAVFMLEHGLNSNNGTTTAVFWNRQTYVGLTGGFGEVLLGRQYTPTFLVHASYDAFGPQGVAAQQVLLGSVELAQAANIRANNALMYRTPAGLGGFSLQAMATDRTAQPGSYQGVKAGYAGGPVSVDVALGRFDNAAVGDVDSITIGGRLNLASLKVYALFNKADSGTGNDSRGLQMSAAYTLGATDLKVSVAESRQRSNAGADIGTTRRYGVGFVHKLSRRTFVYGQVAQLANSKGARSALNGAQTGVNKSSQGLDFGMAHTF
jgi:predicted porin